MPRLHNRGTHPVARIRTGAAPDDCRLARTLDAVFELHRAGVEAGEAGSRIRETFYHYNFTDCVTNLAFICHALLWGNGEFLPSVLSAVNLGRDADCTGASVGAFLGILLGRGGLRPICTNG